MMPWFGPESPIDDVLGVYDVYVAASSTALSVRGDDRLALGSSAAVVVGTGSVAVDRDLKVSWLVRAADPPSRSREPDCPQALSLGVFCFFGLGATIP